MMLPWESNWSLTSASGTIICWGDEGPNWGTTALVPLWLVLRGLVGGGMSTALPADMADMGLTEPSLIELVSI